MTTTRANVCGGCNHHAARHVQGIGCTAGWTYDEHGIATGTDGCLCEWAHTSSMSEREWRAS